ncbi:MAG: ABC transporter ATP-binding protein, partial [bacterium]|nr:ABC transporter ATP-binding protein [bacterium]
MIRLEKVSKYYASGDNNVSLGLHNVSLEMKKGEIIGIVGESGSGKSTFLNVCSLIDTYEDGEIYYDGIPASSFSPEEIDEFRKNHIGFIFQNYNLIDSYTVLQNVLMPLLIKGVDQKEAKEKAKEIIKKVGLENRMHHKGTRLSGGEKQRCVIARALASDSEILACDEPTGNLDSTTGREIIELIKEVASDKLVLIVTHNYDELKDIITRRLTFADGNLIEDVNLKEAENCVDKLKENSEYKFSFKERLRLSIKDIFSTPRKSFLTFMIFLAISLFIAYLYTSLITYKNSYSDEGEFNNVATDRYVIYEDGKKFDMDDFSDYDYNEFAQFEDEVVVMKTESLERAASYVRFSMPNVKLKKGVYPTNDYEVILGIPENALSTCFNETATFDLRFGSYDTYNSNDERIICAKYDEFYEYNGAGSYEPVKYKIVGYYVIKDSTVKHFLVSGTKAFNEKVVNTFIKRRMVNYKADCYYGDYKGVVGELSIDDTVSDDTIKMIASKKYEGKIDNILDNIKFYYADTSHINST